jgi:predicted nucleotidyltransferase
MANITPVITPKLDLPYEQLAEFCARWKVQRLAVFGSVLREDFAGRSDVDFLADFAADAKWTLWDHMTMEEELACLLGRPVDLVDRVAVQESRNWIRRREILSTAREIYVAG